MARINPRIDFAFKKIFASEENKDLLISLVNAILPEADQVADLTVLNPYTIQNFLKDKLSVLDIKAKDKNGTCFNIEMQVTDQLSYQKRALYLWSKVYSGQLGEGGHYGDLKKTIGIHILNFNMMDELDFHNTYAVLNLKSKKRQFEDLQLHTIELEKFDKSYPELKTALDRWITFFLKAVDLDSKMLPKELEADVTISKAVKVIETINFDEQERMIYEGQKVWMMDEAAALEKKYLIGKEEGILEGKIEGELAKSLEIAKVLKTKGFSLEQITEITRLPLDDIQRL